MTTRECIDDFLKQRRLAMVGVSRHENDFSRTLFREFVKRGFDMVPVHPEAARSMAAKPCAWQMSPPVDGVLLMTPAGVTEARRRVPKRASAACGCARQWARGGDPRAVEFCEKAGSQ
jgi:hypothetical protein